MQLSREDGEALRTRLAGDALTADDRRVLDQVLQWYFWLLFALQEATFSLKRLRVLLFGEKPNKRKPRLLLVRRRTPAMGLEGQTVPGARRGGGDADNRSGNRLLLAKRRPGHGRQGAETYVAPSTWSAAMRPWRQASAARCVGVGACIGRARGRISSRWACAPVRGALCPGEVPVFACGQVFTAAAPAEAGADKYSARARAVLVLGRYYLGVPLYRLEGYQAMVGVPVSDATQWDQIERVADCAYPVFEQLQTLAAQGEVIYQDDTHVRILSLIAENRQAQADGTWGSAAGCTPPAWWSSRVSTRSACIWRGVPMRGEPGGAVDTTGRGTRQAAGDVGCARE